MIQNNLSIIFFGTPDFAVASLSALLQTDFKVIGVVTVPDKPAGRGKILMQSSVKTFALKNRIKVLQPENLKDHAFISKLQQLNADLHVVVAFRILPKEVWNMPKYGTINVHASLLPDYRGAAPINHAIINGDLETGVSTFLLEQDIDTGKILLQARTPISIDDNAGTVHDRLMKMGANILVKSIQGYTHGTIIPKLQNTVNTKLRTASKIFHNDCKINWNSEASVIYDFIRGLSPYPAAWSNLIAPTEKIYNVKIFETAMYKAIGETGSILINHGVIVYTVEGALKILSLQLAGKKRMDIDSFLRGFNLDNNWKFN